MATSNNERVGKALELLNTGLRPFVERELRAVYKDAWLRQVTSSVGRGPATGPARAPHLDSQVLLAVVWEYWNPVFSAKLGQDERSLVSELRGVRNRWAHQEPFTTDDTYRALDSIQRLLRAVVAPEAAEVDREKQDVLRTHVAEQARHERRTVADAPVTSQRASGPPPWREVGREPDMQSLWLRMRTLQGQTLLTTSFRHPFDVVSVTDRGVVVEPHETRKPRPIRRAEVEDAVKLGVPIAKLTPGVVQAKGASAVNSAYVVAILRALEEPTP